MAARFWVAGGNGLWSSTTNWSATTGGASGASVPGSADTATFNAASTTVTATVDSSVTIQTLTMTGFTGTLAFGTNTISLNSAGTVYTGATTFTVTGTPVINVTSAGSTTISVSAQAVTEANAISFNFTGGTYSLLLTGAYANINFTGYSGLLNPSGPSIYGNVIFSSTMTSPITSSTTTGFLSTTATRTITTNGRVLDFPISINGVGGGLKLLDALTGGSTRAFNLNLGSVLDLNSQSLTCGNFVSSGTNTRTLAFGTGTITCIGAGGTLCNIGSTGLTVTGTPVINISYSGATATTIGAGNPTEANTISFNITAGTYSLTMLSTNRNYRDINFTGFSGTLVAPGSTVFIYGSLTLSTGMTLSGTTTTPTFGATSTGKTITTNGKPIPFPIQFNGVGGSWILQDSLTMSGSILSQFNGTLDLNGKTLTLANVVNSYTIAAGTKNLTFNGGSMVCTFAGQAVTNNAPTGYTTTAGTGIGYFSFTAATAKSMSGNGSTFNCVVSNDGAGALTIDGSNTVTTVRNTTASSSILLTGSNTIGTLSNTAVPCTFTMTAGTTQTITNWSVSGTAGNLVTINSATAAVHNLVKAGGGIVSADYLTISNSSATPSTLTWYAGTHSTNVTGNTGWIFTAPPTTSAGSFFFMF